MIVSRRVSREVEALGRAVLQNTLQSTTRPGRRSMATEQATPDVATMRAAAAVTTENTVTPARPDAGVATAPNVATVRASDTSAIGEDTPPPPRDSRVTVRRQSRFSRFLRPDEFERAMNLEEDGDEDFWEPSLLYYSN